MKTITRYLTLLASLFTFVSVNAVELTFENMKAGKLNDSIAARGVTAQSVEQLTISGELNGTDIRLIRYMGGNDELGAETTGYSLSVLNLQKARIVAGGEFYIQDSNDVQYTTSNDTFGAYFFAFCNNLLKVNFPESVTTVEKGGFYECKKLKEVIFSSKANYSSLGKEMFNNCPALGVENEIVLPEGITTIEPKTFSECFNLKKISLPEGVETIDESAFFACTKLYEMRLPSTVSIIEEGAFTRCLALKKINFPAKLKKIGNYAFQLCSELKDTIRITKNVALGETVFFDCKMVPAYIVEAGNATCSSEEGVLFNADKTELLFFPAGNRTILEYTVPSSVKTIGFGSFYGGGKFKEGLRKLTVPSTVENIEDEEWIASNLSIQEIIFEPGSPIKSIGGFHQALNLNKIQLPSALDTIRKGAFEWCQLSEIEFPESLVSIESGAFLHCEIKSIKLGKNLQTIGVRAFYDCHQLKNVTIAQDNPYFTAENNVIYSKDKKRLIVYPAGLTAESFTVPSEVETLSEGCFGSNCELKHLKVPESVTSVENYTFVQCSELKTVTLPNNLTLIPEGMCSGCTSLASINIPSEVIEIEKSAFSLRFSEEPDSNVWKINRNNTNIELDSYKPTLGSKIVFPESLDRIGGEAFNVCYFDTLVVKIKEPLELPFGNGNETVFHPNCQASAVLMVPAGTLSAYCAAEQWKDFSKIVEDTPVGVNNIEQSNPTIIPVQGGIRLMVDKSCQLTIHHTDGSIIKQQLAKEGDQFIPLNQGIYIVQLGNLKKKLAITN